MSVALSFYLSIHYMYVCLCLCLCVSVPDLGGKDCVAAAHVSQHQVVLPVKVAERHLVRQRGGGGVFEGFSIEELLLT